jgi:cell division protein FtsA
MVNSRVIGAIEIGTSKTVVLVGEIIGNGQLEIIGKGVASSRGMTKGEIVDFESITNCVHTAILSAERDAGRKIDSVYISQTGAHLGGFYNEGTVNVSSPDNVVSREDIMRAVNEAKSKKIPQGQIYIHHIRNPVYLDDSVVGNPNGMTGRKLRVGYWLVTGKESKVQDHLGIIGGLSLKTDDMIISSLASGVMMASSEEKQNGVLVVDIGSGTTDYVVYKNGFVVCTGVICVGGDHITNDLSMGLRISGKHAEKIKVQYGKAWIDKSDMEERVWTVGDKTIGDRDIPRKAIYKIMNARIEEIFSILKQEVSKHISLTEINTGAILTGGTSCVAGIEQVATIELGMDARLGKHPSWVASELDNPEYSTVLGLFHYALTAEDRDDGKRRAKPKGFFRKLLSL